MNAGTVITGNTGNIGNSYEGGGVYLSWQPRFTKIGGTITGFNSDPLNGNVVRDEAGNVLARLGHAIFSNAHYSSGRQETTAGPDLNLSSSLYDFTGNWETPGSGGTGTDGTLDMFGNLR